MDSTGSDGESVLLLWTGGWDSTFRLLQLLLIEEKSVQPIYLADDQRRSTGIEIETMQSIRNAIIDKYPKAEERLRSVNFISAGEIKPDRQIDRAWRKIRNKRHIGAQYKLLAAFCKQEGLENVELSVQKRISEHRVELSLAYNLDKDRKTESEELLFNCFSFPLLNLSKMDMVAMAERSGWMDILNRTWFCHRPVNIPLFGPVPCGGCNPCIVAIEEGFGGRVPLLNRVFGRIVKRAYHRIKLQM